MSVGLSVFFLSATRHLSTCGAASEYSESSQAVAGDPARERASACTARARARACRTTSQRKNRCADAFQKQNRTRALVGADLGQLVYTYKRVVCVCLLVCLSAFYRPHDICPLCGAASEWPREQEPSSRAAPRARAQACTARARERMPYNFTTKKSLR